LFCSHSSGIQKTLFRPKINNRLYVTQEKAGFIFLQGLEAVSKPRINETGLKKNGREATNDSRSA
jgi:hypothetical protein